MANSTTTTEHIQFNYFYSCSLRARRAVFKVLGPVTPSFEVTEGVGGGRGPVNTNKKKIGVTVLGSWQKDNTSDNFSAERSYSDNRY